MGWLVRFAFGMSATGGVALAGTPLGYGSSPVHVEGLKIAAPHFQRSEAGVAWSLGGGLSLQLHYERGAYAPREERDRLSKLVRRRGMQGGFRPGGPPAETPVGGAGAGTPATQGSLF